MLLPTLTGEEIDANVDVQVELDVEGMRVMFSRIMRSCRR